MYLRLPFNRAGLSRYMPVNQFVLCCFVRGVEMEAEF